MAHHVMATCPQHAEERRQVKFFTDTTYTHHRWPEGGVRTWVLLGLLETCLSSRCREPSGGLRIAGQAASSWASPGCAKGHASCCSHISSSSHRTYSQPMFVPIKRAHRILASLYIHVDKCRFEKKIRFEAILT